MTSGESPNDTVSEDTATEYTGAESTEAESPGAESTEAESTEAESTEAESAGAESAGVESATAEDPAQAVDGASQAEARESAPEKVASPSEVASEATATGDDGPATDKPLDLPRPPRRIAKPQPPSQEDKRSGNVLPSPPRRVPAENLTRVPERPGGAVRPKRSSGDGELPLAPIWPPLRPRPRRRPPATSAPAAPAAGPPTPPGRTGGQLQRPPWLPATAWDELPFELRNSNTRERWLYAGLGATVVVIIAVAVALVAIGRGGGNQASPPVPHPLASAHNKDQAVPPAWKMNSAEPNPVAQTADGDGSPVIPGYQVVAVHRLGAAYDVPRDWRIDPVGTAVWGSAPDALEVTGLAQDGTNYCPNNVRTNAFVATSNDSDLAKAAADIGAHVARVGWPAAPAARTTSAEPLGSLDGQLHGEFVETDGTTLSTTAGCAETFAVYTFAVPNENGSFVMTVAADTGVPRSVDRETAKRLVASMRPALMH